MTAIAKITESLEKIIEQNGYRDDDNAVCGLCNGFRFVNTSKGTQTCECTRKDYYSVFYKEIFGRNYGHTFTDIETMPNYCQTNSHKACKKIYEMIITKQPAKALILCEGHGRGKTYSACALLKELSQHRIATYGFMFPAIVDLYRDGFDTKQKQRDHEKYIRNAAFVLADEVFNQEEIGNPEIPIKILRYLVRTCEEADPQKSFILTTNISQDKIISLLPSDLKDRLDPVNGYCTFIREPYNESLRKRVSNGD